jgi:hypothetical protein
MAPNHSFDLNTLKALKQCGFTAVTDGISLYPFRLEGLVFIPQQLWRPRWMPHGVITICLHTNDMRAKHVKALRTFLRRPFHFTSFSKEAQRDASTYYELPLNHAFRMMYAGMRRLAKQRPITLPSTAPSHRYLERGSSA